ncbi:MAG: hypothetical protein ACRDJ5_00575 [Actinomycetota bacterium]
MLRFRRGPRRARGAKNVLGSLAVMTLVISACGEVVNQGGGSGGGGDQPSELVTRMRAGPRTRDGDRAG